MKSPCRRFVLSHILYYLLSPIAHLVFFLRYRMRFRVSPEVRNLKGPMVILGNHVNQWDPFFAAIGLHRPVHYIASDFVFRKPLLGGLLRALGAVPKVKFRSDMGSLRTLMDVKRCGSVVGIFPEGHVNWAGETLPIVPSTAKLLRLLKAPVVTVKIRGGYIARPRWRGVFLTAGELFEYQLILRPEELRSMTVAQINDYVQKALHHNEWEYLRESPRRLPRKNRAIGLERALFICPECGSYSSMEGRNNEFSCNSCTTSMRIGEQGFPENSAFSQKFEDISAWDRWQQEKLREDISAALENGGGAVFAEEDSSISQSSDGIHFDITHSWGRVEFRGNAIVLSDDQSNEILSLPVAELSGIAVQNSEEIEFYHGNKLTKIEFPDSGLSAYKWLSALTVAQGLLRVSEEV